jgi:rubrerythrin
VTDTELEEQESGLEGEQDDSQPGEPEITEEDAAEQEESPGEFVDTAADPEPEPEGRGLSEQEIEKQYKALEKEQNRHTSNVTRIMGDEAVELIVCPLCEPELGGFLRMESLDHPRDEMHEAMIGVLKKPPQVAYLNAPHAATCADCDGLGNVLSGSRVAGQEKITCPSCKGMGYRVASGADDDSRPIYPSTPYVPSGLPHEPLVEERDEFGSPATLPDGRDNPNYGKTMRHKDPSIENDYLTRLSGVV